MNAKQPYRQARGFTLVEAMVSMAVMSVMMAAVFDSMTAISNGVHTSYTVSERDRMTNVALSRIAQSLFDCAVIAPVAPFSSSHTIVFKVLYDADNDGTPLEWGVNRINTPWNDAGWISYTFVKERELNEGALGDINGDGDATDIFWIGSIIKTMHSESNGERVTIVLRNVLQATSATSEFGGDISGDGVNNPLFTMDDAKMVTITVWSYARDNRGRDILDYHMTKVRLIN